MTYELTDDQYADLCKMFGVPAVVRGDFNKFAEVRIVNWKRIDDARAKDESCTGGGSDK